MNYLRKYLPEFVYGGIDGTVTTFAVVTGALGAALSPKIILILGFANLFADGFSMAASNYLSRKSESNDTNPKLPLKTAVATFCAFVVIGIVPLISFVFASFIPSLNGIQFELAILLTAIVFIFVGAVRGQLTGEKIGLAAIETLLIGGAAAAISYGIGAFLKNLVGGI
jgi:vacuolar iron transporter family protein